MPTMMLACCRNSDTDGWEGDIEDSAEQGHFGSQHSEIANSPSLQSMPAEQQHSPNLQLAEEEATGNGSKAAQVPSSVPGQGRQNSIAAKAGPVQSDAASENVAGAKEQGTGLHLQSLGGKASSSVEKPGTPPRLASPKSPQPAKSSPADDDKASNRLANGSSDRAAASQEVMQPNLTESAQLESLQKTSGVCPPLLHMGCCTACLETCSPYLEATALTPENCYM